MLYLNFLCFIYILKKNFLRSYNDDPYVSGEKVYTGMIARSYDEHWIRNMNNNTDFVLTVPLDNILIILRRSLCGMEKMESLCHSICENIRNSALSRHVSDRYKFWGFLSPFFPSGALKNAQKKSIIVLVE